MARLVALLKHLFPEDTIREYYNEPAIPYQADTVNCGVYVCMYAYHWLQRGTLPTTTDFSRFDCPAFRSFMSHTLAKAVSSPSESIAKKYPPRCVIPRVFLAMPTVCQPPFDTAPPRQTTGRGAASCPLVISDSD